jgi:predicted RNase H-like nuclease (RuvC/YqgF family)
VTDGQSNTIIVGEEPPATTVVGGSVTDGRSNTILVAETVTGALTLEVGPPPDRATTTTVAPAGPSSSVTCDAVTPLVDDLVLALETARATTQHRLERVQQRRAELVSRLETAADDQRPDIEEQIARRDRRIARLTRQLDRIDEQIAALDGLVAPCRS